MWCVCVCERERERERERSILVCAHTFLLILVSVAYLSRANLDTCMHALVPFEAYPAITTHARVCDRTDIQQDANTRHASCTYGSVVHARVCAHARMLLSCCHM